MEKRLNFFGALFFLTAPLLLMGFGWFGTSPMTAFTPNGYATINATTSSASAVLGSSAGSTPSANMAIVTNLGPNVAWINLGASNVVATVAGGYPVPASSVARISLTSATYAAAITQTGTATISVVTGY